MTLDLTMHDRYRLLRWAEVRLGIEPGRIPSESEAIGVISKETGEIQAVVLFNAFYSRAAAIHIATNGKRSWASRFVLKCIFGYAFDHKGLLRLNAIQPVANIDAQVMALKLGFRLEGVAKCGAHDGTDAVLLGMTRDTCPWLDDQGA